MEPHPGVTNVAVSRRIWDALVYSMESYATCDDPEAVPVTGMIADFVASGEHLFDLLELRANPDQRQTA